MVVNDDQSTVLNLHDRIGEHTIIEQININPILCESIIKHSDIQVTDDVLQYIQARKMFVKKPNKHKY